ncbi:holin-associated N-acetylmuramidase [Pseudorhodobacter wandonensis]|uniref:holin-associated N-acetylmuramidase n=1 Tax=Pseudorhodobacter wandonensis TaxID=1120568 RepID=UPI00067E1903|nr:holin-associated N-acetylmuramidase [Pseudorhodobacter wandonensis]
MQTVQEIAQDIIAREGGFVNDADDPGGATKYGVTIHTLQRLGVDVNGDGAVDVADVKALDHVQAVDIYIEHYFKRPGIGQLPEVLQASVFDMMVNAGNNAVKLLQRLLTDMGFACIPDGAIGPQTISAAQRAFEAAPGHIADAYAIARRNYYYRLADARPASRKYARKLDGGKGGWITRAEEFMDPKYRLTNAEHSKRVAAWG